MTHLSSLQVKKMLIPLSSIVDKYNMTLTGVVHIGAHECEELEDYSKYITPDKIIWVEAQSSLVRKAWERGIHVHQAVLSDIEGETREFIVTNNSASSSLLELKEHLTEHPWVREARREVVTTTTFDRLVQTANLDVSTHDFLNLDIQGMELAVLKGMKETLHHFKYIYTEVNTKELYAGCALLRDMDAYLSTQGFTRVETVMTPHGWGDALYTRLNQHPHE